MATLAAAARIAALGLLVVAGGAVAQKGPAGLPTIVTDDFADRNTGWTLANGGIDGYTIDYVDGAYLIYAPGPTGALLASTGFAFADGAIGVDVANMPLSPPHLQGVFLRAQDPDNFYAISIASDTSFVAYHILAGAFVPDGPIDGYLPAGLYRFDAPNRIEAIVNGRDIRYLLNGVTIATVPNVIWPDGVAGVVVINTAGTPAGSAFDNWRIDVVR